MSTTVYQPQGAAVPETALAPIVHSDVRMGMDTIHGFEALQRAAKMLSAAAIVPESYRGKVADCAIVLDIAIRLRMSPILVMQNLYIVKGKPGWSGQFAIAVVNNSGLFSQLDFEWKGKQGDESWGCRAVAHRARDQKRLEGSWVDIVMVKREGWFSKKDREGNETSKWQSMPEQMFVYRAASFWLRRWFPEGLLGLPTEDEVIDITPVPPVARVVELSPPPPVEVAPVEPTPEPAGALSPGVDLPAMATAPAEAAPVAAPAPAKKGLEATKERIRQAKERLAEAARPGPAHTDPPDDELGLRAPAVTDYQGNEKGEA